MKTIHLESKSASGIVESIKLVRINNCFNSLEFKSQRNMACFTLICDGSLSPTFGKIQSIGEKGCFGICGL